VALPFAREILWGDRSIPRGRDLKLEHGKQLSPISLDHDWAVLSIQITCGSPERGYRFDVSYCFGMWFAKTRPASDFGGASVLLGRSFLSDWQFHATRFARFGRIQ
jgi:hypothetical protein